VPYRENLDEHKPEDRGLPGDAVTGAPPGVLAAHQRRRLIIRAALRTLATIAVLVTLYYVLPFDHVVGFSAVAELVVGLVVLVVLLLIQIQVISRHDHPGLRAVEALALTIPLYLLLFATTYFLMARGEATTFTAPLTRTDAVYFSVTVFSTVGFGDITAKSEAARVIVTFQMLLDLVVLGVVVRAILDAVKRGQDRNAPQAPD